LLGCISFADDPIGYACVLVLVSFDCHPGSPFFSHRRRTLLLLVSIFSFRCHLLSLRRRPLPFRQQHSLSLLRRSLARSLCSDIPTGLCRSSPPAARELRIALNFSPQKVSAAVAGRLATCATAKGASERRPRRHPKQTPPCPLPWGSAPSSALSPRPRRRLRSSSSVALSSYVESPHQGGN
jgi:hypothetical protein